ncbi:hypothetical protein Egran_06241 [Elaphomyces granulatus]|uniref:Small-subunit processome Utp12 domain-containing protein n=1 Tax=Elaphomyces granulatus TaxID=519963 RepID=A0A232LPA2_9EURO|nr:hypothetical protein Egran_06241 [Elaphomyces granulatus]
MGKRTSRPAVSKTSAAALPAVSGATRTGNKSSVLRAAFSPSEYQLALFASVIQGLDAQHLRIHDISTGRIRCEHAVGTKESITSLDWGCYRGDRPRDREQKLKKRKKRDTDANGLVNGVGAEDVVVAFGTSISEIRMYSPVEDRIVGTLSGGHDRGIKDFKFTATRPYTDGWSIGGDNKLVHWDLQAGQCLRIVNLPMSSVVTALSRPVPSNPPVICASQAPFIIDVEKTDDPPTSFPAMRNLIHTLISSRTDFVVTGQFLAADSDRYVNIFDPQRRKLVANLVTEKGVSSLSLYSRSDDSRKEGNKDLISPEKQLLAAVTQDGAIELFVNPFFQAGEPQGSKPATSLKLRASQMTRKADSLVKIVHPESGAIVPVVTADFQGPELVVAWAEGGVNVVFERVRWQDANTGELSFKGTKEITRSKPASVLGSAAINGYRAAHESHVDESKAVLVSGHLVDDIDMHDVQGDSISISSGEESSGDEKERQKSKESGKKPTRANRNAAGKDVEMRDIGNSEVEQGEEAGEPSFGELLRATAPEAIDVEVEVDAVDSGSLVPRKGTAPTSEIPSGVSLSTVLTQALRTNDHAMLESCFHVGDLVIVRATIQRLDSSLAVTLLQRLAERLASRPGRFGHLLVWVQWTCIAHGGAIAGKPDILKRMSALFQVMDQRSSSLPSLLLLKGKLDMLDAQLKLRQSSARRDIENMDSEDEDIIYVEGQDDVDDSEVEAAPKPSTTTPHTKSTRDTHGSLAEDGDDATPNGIASSSVSENDENSDEAVSDVDNLLDIEAEESTGSSDAEESLEEHEADSDEESVSSMDDFIASSNDEDLSDAVDGTLSTPPPSKKAKLSGQEKKKPALRRK